jgi:hypothetical protein
MALLLYFISFALDSFQKNLQRGIIRTYRHPKYQQVLVQYIFNQTIHQVILCLEIMHDKAGVYSYRLSRFGNGSIIEPFLFCQFIKGPDDLFLSRFNNYLMRVCNPKGKLP